MLDVFNDNIMRFSYCFRIEKKQNQTGNRPKSEKKRENEQVNFGLNAPFLAVPT
jgi:hypothetical protein